ncbi:unnamed protein product [Vitrella brassicaformis CCMP3155]|uniref:RRM domain-containing protein n=1 Tax=Vitrella brassicaformis (strain CCMP3155) TaxID=1169540 RepID=A0A0G4FGG8_VITBC|nr:unnamed protein product [Vitrella brassicaformis CCMP3155]|eukprot:CEM11929.1 unnamed protein product [Vitrella brassicaformis CCMP3155]
MSRSSRIIVKGVPKHWDERRLKQHIERIGQAITDCKIAKTRDGKTRQFAFVGFKSADAAQNAVDYFNQTYLDTSKVTVEFAVAPESKQLPRPWSKYSKGSSAHARLNQPDEADGERVAEKGGKGKLKDRGGDEVVEDAGLQEFLDVVGKRRGKQTWANEDTVSAAVRQDSVKPTKAGVASTRTHLQFDDDEPEDEDQEDVNDFTEVAAMDDRGTEGRRDKASIAFDESVDDMAYLRSKMTATSKPAADDEPSPDTQQQDDQHPGDADMVGSPASNDEGDEPMGEGDSSPMDTTNDLKVDLLADDDGQDGEMQLADSQQEEEDLASSGRLFLMNLSYETTEKELRDLCGKHGEIAEVHIPKDELSGRARGIAYVTYVFPEQAVKALPALHKHIFQGRLLKAFPAKPKPKTVEVEKVVGGKKKGTSSYKQKLQEKKEQVDGVGLEAGNPQQWNLLYVSANAATDVIAQQLGIEKRDLLDVSSDNLAVRVALGETRVLQDTRRWLKEEGIHVEAFERVGNSLLTARSSRDVPRSDDTLIVKHLPANTTEKDLQDLFVKSGPIMRLCLAPSRTVAVVQFVQPSHARAAFKALAYKRFKQVPLYLEWAPADVFTDSQQDHTNHQGDTSSAKPNGKAKEDTKDTQPEDKLKQLIDRDRRRRGEKPLLTDDKKKALRRAGVGVEDGIQAAEGEGEGEEAGPEGEGGEGVVDGSSLFVKNLNFRTTDDDFTELFGRAKGFRKAIIMKKKRGGKEGEQAKTLSMGYGFVEFTTPDHAFKALKSFQGVVLDGHSLQLKVAGRQAANTNTTRSPPTPSKGRTDEAGNIDLSKVTSKLVVRNLAFEASRRDVRQLFSAYGNVKSIRLPKKADGTSRGYAFVDFLTRSEALAALEALQHTHLYGRHLVIEPASADDTSVEAAQQKAKRQLESGVRESEAQKRRKSSKLDMSGGVSGAFEGMLE